MLSIKIPATSANLGLGFDSMGIALNIFLKIKAQQGGGWKFTYNKEKSHAIPLNHNNLIAKSAIFVAKKYQTSMPPLSVQVDSDIPLARGLGSSSSAIVAGIELANYYCKLKLNLDEKLKIACEIEGHPDNVGPCITGGGFIGAYVEGELYYNCFSLTNDLALIITIPDYEVLTEEARGVMPEHYYRKVAIEQNALNNVMVAALLRGDYLLMGELMMQDRYHEVYRRKLVKEFELVKSISLSQGAYATVISGAGPTILTLCPRENCEKILEKLTEVNQCQHLQVEIFEQVE